MEGIDVARVDEDQINWEAVKQGGKSFVIMRAYYRDGRDLDFPTFWPAARAAGLVRGAYLLMDLTADNPDIEVKGFLDTTGQLGPNDFPPVIDLEQIAQNPWDKTVVLANTRKLIDSFKQTIGIAPMIYTSARVWSELLGNPTETGFSECPLWVKDYAHDDPLCPAEWGAGNYWIHQYAEDAKGVAGVTGQADHNRFNVLQLGATGPRAEWLQARLGLSGDRFDQATLSAVKLYQQRMRLQQDGIVGVQTFSHLVWP